MKFYYKQFEKILNEIKEGMEVGAQTDLIFHYLEENYYIYNSESLDKMFAKGKYKTKQDLLKQVLKKSGFIEEIHNGYRLYIYGTVSTIVMTDTGKVESFTAYLTQ